MKKLVGALFVLLLLSNVALDAEAIDEVFQKPADRKTWGQQLAYFFGFSDYSKSYALVVGISTYDEYSYLPTENDPIRVKDFLLNVAGFDHVHLLTESNVTISRIGSLMVDKFPELVGKDDRFLFYWSGHGVSRPVGEGAKGYLPLKSTSRDVYSEMISMDNIVHWDGLIKGKQTFYLLDSCFSGLAGVVPASDDAQLLTIEQMAGPSRHLMTAGKAGEETIAIDSLGGSVFTTAVLDGLLGAADTQSGFPRDGIVTTIELEQYVKLRVAFERHNHNWEKSITPQVRDLSLNEGAFFFLTGDYKAGKLLEDGLQPTDEFFYGEPVPMSQEVQPPDDSVPPTLGQAYIVVDPDTPVTSEQLATITAPNNSMELSSEQIRQAQKRLREFGLNPGAVDDGILGPYTSKAIRQFQAMEGLAVNGNLDNLTWEVLTQAVIQETTSPIKSITNSLGMEFVYIKPGTFVMGSPESESGRFDNEQPHKVILSHGFYIQTTEVTQEQWYSVMDNNPSGFQECGSDCPVEQVSWDDVQDFIEKLNAETESGTYRLPTEAEWEYAARAGTQTPFAFGDCLSTNQANYNGNYPLEDCPEGEYRVSTLPVGSLQPNDWGLYDMHGNAYEWCQDWYTEDLGADTVIDPDGPSDGAYRVIRGGSWDHDAGYCRCAIRIGLVPGYRIHGLGFRLVLLPGQQTSQAGAELGGLAAASAEGRRSRPAAGGG